MNEQTPAETFEQRYLAGNPPWDTGVTPPELIELIESDNLLPGKALDLGCGTGTNCLYLAQHGWEAVGVDFSSVAIERARRKARQARIADETCQFYKADVTDLSFLSGPFDLALDIGCLRSLPPEKRGSYAAEVARLVPSGGVHLLYAHAHVHGRGITPTQVRHLFASDFVMERQEDEFNASRPGWQSSWYWMKRTANERGKNVL